jgi:hypothetical protein
MARARRSATVLRGDRPRRLGAAFAIILLALVAWRMLFPSRPPWKIEQVPIAFWAWRNNTPSQADLSEARRLTGADTLFLRAGQIDLVEGRPKRIRDVVGSIPNTLNVHFVYNASRKLLAAFERLESHDLASAILDAQIRDCDRARQADAHVVGLQLDFDVPTRLLPKYADLLAMLRAQMPTELRLSITGLSTWMTSTSLSFTLSKCDFWVPQLYGARIPQRVHDSAPISSSDFVAQSVSRASGYQKPFYAGLSAYGYAIHYDADGRLIEFRGDLDPAQAAQCRGLEAVEMLPLKNQEGSLEEWRTLYRARQDSIVDGTALMANDYLVLEAPTAAGLRACAQRVRAEAGASLLGICVFRVPTLGDKTSLTILQIAEALKDLCSMFSLNARIDRAPPRNGSSQVNALLTLENVGSMTCRADDEALIVLIRLRGECLQSVAPSENATSEPLFEINGEAQSSSYRRANALKISTKDWSPGTRLTLGISLTGDIPAEIELEYRGYGEDGRLYRGVITLRKVAGEARWV